MLSAFKRSMLASLSSNCAFTEDAGVVDGVGVEAQDFDAVLVTERAGVEGTLLARTSSICFSFLFSASSFSMAFALTRACSTDWLSQEAPASPPPGHPQDPLPAAVPGRGLLGNLG